MVLALVTATIVLGGVSYLVGERKVTQWRTAVAERQRLGDEKRANARAIAQREERASRLESMRSRLPVYPATRPVTAELLKLIKGKADTHQLALSQMRPGNEKAVGDLSEVEIDCTWEGTLEAITRFWHDVQQQGAMMDIRSVTMQPSTGQSAGKLKGNFTIFCAFIRTAAEGSGEP
jgi:Tfp pilus assembly protein PilO